MTQMTAPTGLIPQWTVGDRMAKALDVAGISRQEMADYLGVDRNTVGNYLHGRTKPNRRTLLLWASATGVDLVWITSGGADSVTRGRNLTGWLRGQRAKPKRRPHHGAAFPAPRESPERVTVLRPTG